LGRRRYDIGNGHHTGAGPGEAHGRQFVPSVPHRVVLLHALQRMIAIVAADDDQAIAEQGTANRIPAQGQRADLRD